jgi:peptidoglycan/LPS O-acetylase OafA/YrhL
VAVVRLTGVAPGWMAGRLRAAAFRTHRATVAFAPARHLEYRADLDGLRAVAILLVILDHAEWPITNDGGQGGVTAFFVLSGFLITTLLEAERRASGRIDLRAFYLRRALRLLPALAVVIAFVTVIGLAGGWGDEPWGVGVVASPLYVGNWLPLLGIGLGPMAHTWSLAIEEQFYLVWPVALMLVPRRWLPWGMAGLIVVAIAQRWVLDVPWGFMTTTARMDALLVGCAIALWGRPLPKLLGPIAIAILVGTSVTLTRLILEPAMISAAVIVLVRPAVLEPLAPLGRRAYGIYLWNWPLTLLVGPLAIPLSLVAAELSYRFVERPALRLKARIGVPTRPWRTIPLSPSLVVDEDAQPG